MLQLDHEKLKALIEKSARGVAQMLRVDEEAFIKGALYGSGFTVGHVYEELEKHEDKNRDDVQRRGPEVVRVVDETSSPRVQDASAGAVQRDGNISILSDKQRSNKPGTGNNGNYH